MRRLAVVILGAIVLGQQAPAQEDSKALVERVCGKCHTMATATGQRNTRERWSVVVDDMISRGAEATDSEIEKIIDYLAKNYGPKVKPRAIDVKKSRIHFGGAQYPS